MSSSDEQGTPQNRINNKIKQSVLSDESDDEPLIRKNKLINNGK